MERRDTNMKENRAKKKKKRTIKSVCFAPLLGIEEKHVAVGGNARAHVLLVGGPYQACIQSLSDELQSAGQFVGSCVYFEHRLDCGPVRVARLHGTHKCDCQRHKLLQRRGRNKEIPGGMAWRQTRRLG